MFFISLILSLKNCFENALKSWCFSNEDIMVPLYFSSNHKQDWILARPEKQNPTPCPVFQYIVQEIVNKSSTESSKVPVLITTHWWLHDADNNNKKIINHLSTGVVEFRQGQTVRLHGLL